MMAEVLYKRQPGPYFGHSLIRFDTTYIAIMYSFYITAVLSVFSLVGCNEAAFLHLDGTDPLSQTVQTEPFSVQNSSRESDGACVCKIVIPATVRCSSDPDNNETMEEEFASLSSRLEHHATVVEGQAAAIASLAENMTSVLDLLSEIEAGELVVTRPEFDGLRREIANMEDLLILLRDNSTVSGEIVAALEAEVRNMTSALRRLEGEEGADIEQLEAEVATLRGKLLECQQDDIDERASVFFSYDWDRPGHADSCKKLDNVSAPFTMNGRVSTQARGTWFRDPLRDQSKVYLFSISSRNQGSRYSSPQYSAYAGQTVVEYESMRAFQLGQVTRHITITEYAEGSSMVAYNGSLYYHVYNSRQIAKYDIEKGHQLKSELPAGTKRGNEGAYMSRSNSDVDFAVDESGLWVIYTTTSSNGVIIISKLDPETLLRTETWTTSVTKSSQGNCFVVCQVLHCTNSYNTHTDKINFYYDTNTAVESFMYVPIDSKFLATYALSYNPYDQKLFAWDNGHQVIYQLLFEE